MHRKLIHLFCLVLVLGLARAEAAEPAPLRWKLDPGKPMHVQGAGVLTAMKSWRLVPADIRPIAVLELDNHDNSARTVRFEKCFKVCQENGIAVAPEIVREGKTNDTINVGWLDGMFKKYPKVIAIVFNCNAPDQLKTGMMREYLEVCGQNGAYFLYNMNFKGQTFPEHLDKMLADPALVATMNKYHQNIVVNYYAGGYDVILTDAQKAENLEKVKKMLADGLLGRIGYFYREMGATDIDRESANGCTAFGGMHEFTKADYWNALRKL